MNSTLIVADAYPVGYELPVAEIAESLIDSKFRNSGDDYTRIDGVVSWQLDSFHDMDYIWGAHLTLAIFGECVNTYLDDLFLLDMPGREVVEGVVYAKGRSIRSKWVREPRRFFDYRGDLLRKRSHQFINWMHDTMRKEFDAQDRE